MQTNIPSTESLKEKAKVVRKFLKDKCNADVSHSHCLELIAQVYGIKDWNTASAVSKPVVNKSTLPFKVETVGDMRKALEPFKDSDVIDGMYEFKIADFLDKIENASEDGIISQEFRLTLEDLDEGKAEPRIASFKLNLEHEDVRFESEDGIHGGDLSLF